MQEPSHNKPNFLFYQGLGAFLLPVAINMLFIWLIHENLSNLDRMPPDQIALSLNRLLAADAFANFLAGLVLTFLYRKFLTTRFDILIENAQRLPKGLPLNKSVSGNDQLSYLDEVLHSASDELRKLSEHRQSLMEMVAHDLRSPLMSSQIALDILSSGRAGELPAMVKRQIDSINRNVERTVALVNDLLTVDRIQAGRIKLTLTDTHINRVADETMQALEHLARRKNVTLVSNCEDVVVVADSARLLQVLNNLVSNAIHFSPHNANVEIKANIIENNVEISVLDEGPGIAVDVQSQLFDKFYQASGKSKLGFGLGLTICKHIIQLHGGKVGVESQPGRGSRFYFTLALSVP